MSEETNTTTIITPTDSTVQVVVTPAHTAKETESFLYTFPAHEPRESDPHYHAFNAARRRLEKLGALKCWIDNADCQGAIELHHAIVEFSLAQIVDVAHFEKLYPEFKIDDDEKFLTWINAEANLLPLCVQHHRGVIGVHSIHYPAWVVQRFMIQGITAPERKVMG